MKIQDQDDRFLTLQQARKIARAAKVRLPRCGYEVALGDGRWLASRGHHQFGSFGLSEHAKAHPFYVY